MNKILAGILAVSMTAGLVSAQEPVLSRNAVGYVKVEVQAGNFVIVRNDFNLLSGEAPTPSTVYGSTLPLGSRIFLYNPVSLSYETSTFELGTDPITFLAVEQWSNDSLDLSPGRSWWVQPGGVGFSDIIAMGEVPDTSNIAVEILPGFNMISYPYPAQIAWVDTELAKSAAIGDRAYFFEGGSYVTSTYQIGTDPDTFQPVEQWSTSDIILQPGVGFWYEAASGRTVDESRPYSWPNDN